MLIDEFKTEKVKTETTVFTGQKPQEKVHDQKAEVKSPLAQQRNSAIVCYYCGREGHVRCDCRARKGQQKKKPWAKPQQQINHQKPPILLHGTITSNRAAYRVLSVPIYQ